VKVSIVVPAYNEERLLGTTLDAINRARSAFDRHQVESELIVCDNNSTDRTTTIAQVQGAMVVSEPVNQIGRARNRGAAAATGDWLIFIDADSQPSPELFSDVLEAIRTGRFIAGGCLVRLEGNHRAAQLLTNGWNRLSRWRKLLAGSFIFVETAAFRAIGGFDEAFFTGEELDLSLRLRKQGRQSSRSICILTKHPLLTSDRKVKLYSSRELVTFLLRAILLPRRTMRSKAACYAWYDGRR